MVAKAEWLPGLRGRNARYVVTNISRKKVGARALYEHWYCARGDMENRIKDQQLWLFSDRTSAHIMRANQLRMYFSALAGFIVDTVRRVGLKDTRCARWRVDTIRSRLFKLAGRVTKTVRRLRLCLASTFPLQDVFARTLVQPACRGPGATGVAPAASHHSLMTASPEGVGRGVPGARRCGHRSVKNRPSIPSA